MSPDCLRNPVSVSVLHRVFIYVISLLTSGSRYPIFQPDEQVVTMPRADGLWTDGGHYILVLDVNSGYQTYGHVD